jgi:geranylgeranyl pyrophosphate synthase
MLSAMPSLALDRLDVASELRNELHLTLGRGLAEMAAGQEEDVRTEDPSIKRAIRVLERKSGAQLGLFAEFAARTAGAGLDDAAAYRSFGRNFGAAAQARSDLADIWTGGADLRNGRVSLPIAHGLSSADGDRIGDALTRARVDPDAGDEVRKLLLSAGSARFAGFVIETYVVRARRELDRTNPAGAAGEELRAMIDGVSLVG